MAEKAEKEKASRRIARLMKEMQAMHPTHATEERFQEIVVELMQLPAGHRPPQLLATLATVFGKPVATVNNMLRVRNAKDDFDALIPEEGWIREYIEYTRKTEPPSVFHYFVAATVLGATLGRRVYFDKGAYRVFPNFCVMVVAPSGECRKTSACNLGVGLFLKAGGNLLADKTTPEALLDALKDSAEALIYGAELSVFLGKQKYQEGMIPLLTALFDCPDEFSTKTMGRGQVTLTGVGLSAIMCSTPDWLQTGIPADAFGGGFMSRFMFVVQHTTPRCFPIPPPLNKETKQKLILQLAAIRNLKATVTMTKKAEQWYDTWYRSRKHGVPIDRQFAGYYERKPDHLIRIAIVNRVSKNPKDLEITDQDLARALQILEWLEEYLPDTFDRLTSSAVGEEQVRLLQTLRRHGGSMEHSVLLRRVSGRMNADQFRRSIETLKEAKLIEWDPPAKSYFLTPEGWQ